MDAFWAIIIYIAIYYIYVHYKIIWPQEAQGVGREYQVSAQEAEEPIWKVVPLIG